MITHKYKIHHMVPVAVVYKPVEKNVFSLLIFCVGKKC